MDVAIVGAGPAGASAGAWLASEGHVVTLYDPSHPREKPCGGGVPPGAFRRYETLDGVARLGRSVRAVRFAGPRGGLLRVRLPRSVVVFSRRVLDGALLERALEAGSRFRPERVRRVAVEPKGVALETSSGTRRHEFVIGADGAASVVRRSLLGPRSRPAGACATAGFHVQGLREEELVVEFLRDLPGYLWVFPRPDHASVGIVCPARRLGGAALRSRVAAFLARRYPGSERLPRTPYGAVIPCPTPRDVRCAPVAGLRFALIGDAAGQVDAITGEGIEHALGSAAALATALADGDSTRAGARYAEAWQRGRGRELLTAARWARWAYRPATVALCLAVARRSVRARRIMEDLLMVEQPYTTLARRLLRELGSALQWRAA